MKNFVFSFFLLTSVSVVPTIGFASSAFCIDTGPEASFEIVFDGGLTNGETKSVQAWNRPQGSSQFEDLGVIEIHVESIISKTFHVKIISGKLKGKDLELECPTSNLPF